MDDSVILFEDGDILVINKPAGIIVNKADTTRFEKTVQEWAETHIEIKRGEVEETVDASGYSPVASFFDRGGIVHRLDKETSGVLIIAKNPTSYAQLQNQFKERVVKKTYVALVHGVMRPEVGEVNAPIGRLPWNRMRFGVVAGGREALTRYRALATYTSPTEGEQYTFVELYPETGRTHQLRVHLKHIGYPILSDPLYGGRKQARSDRGTLTRVFLHAGKLSLNHPTTGEKMEFEAPLPQELSSFMQSLTIS